ncbi:unnamed protein product [Pleuronectes platessa]|uniref:Uncharacterized protein n=1 Tax=Pleuronectes platessa TaxID=8262 RepID=A0A9N7VUU4_PLEPL|nr:unnamed protein product [Pleuronectes platessa]
MQVYEPPSHHHHHLLTQTRAALPPLSLSGGCSDPHKASLCCLDEQQSPVGAQVTAGVALRLQRPFVCCSLRRRNRMEVLLSDSRRLLGSGVFKCAAQKSFHDIISCQYGKPVTYIQKFKPGQQQKLDGGGGASHWDQCTRTSALERGGWFQAEPLACRGRPAQIRAGGWTLGLRCDHERFPSDVLPPHRPRFTQQYLRLKMDQTRRVIERRGSESSRDIYI